jgi:hypothetical protein
MADDKNKSKSSIEETSAAASAPASDTGVRADAAPSESASKPVRKVKFAVEQKSPTLEIGHGEYNRKFVADDQPFEVDEEEFVVLIGTGLFVEA